MSIRFFFFSNLWLLYILSSHAQPTHVLNLDNQSIKLPDFPYHIVQVVDARPDTTYLGFSYRGITSIQKEIQTKQPLAQELQALFQRSFPPTEQTQALIVKINHFFTYESEYKGQSNVFSQINLSFIIKENGQYYELFESTNKSDRAKQIHRHKKHITKSLKSCFQKFQDRLEKQSIEKKALPIEKVTTYHFDPNNYAAFHSPTKEKGIFYTFEDFRDQCPRTDKPFDISYTPANKKGHSSSARIQWKVSRVPIEKVWGFTDGHYTYINYPDSRRFYQLNLANDQFTTHTPGITNTQGAFAGALLGGLIGGFIGSMADYTKANKKKITYHLDFTVGHLTTPKIKQLQQKFGTVIFHTSEYLKKDAQLLLKIADTTVCQLSRKTYHALHVAPDVTELEVCFQLNNGEDICEMVHPVVYETQLYLIRGKKTPKVMKTPQNMRSGVLKDIKNAKLKKVKSK